MGALYGAVLWVLAASPPPAVAALGIPIPGADPTGSVDSAAALNRAVRALCNATAAAPAVPRDAVLDLDNGVCLLSAPIGIDRTVHCSGVLRIVSGTLLASNALGGAGTENAFLVTVVGCWAGLGVSIDRVTFASNGTGGGLRVDDAGHVHVSDSRFLNFNSVGIWVRQFRHHRFM